MDWLHYSDHSQNFGSNSSDFKAAFGFDLFDLCRLALDYFVVCSSHRKSACPMKRLHHAELACAAQRGNIWLLQKDCGVAALRISGLSFWFPRKDSSAWQDYRASVELHIWHFHLIYLQRCQQFSFISNRNKQILNSVFFGSIMTHATGVWFRASASDFADWMCRRDELTLSISKKKALWHLRAED